MRDNGLPPDAGAWLLRLIGVARSAQRRSNARARRRSRHGRSTRCGTLFLKASLGRPLVIMVEDHPLDRSDVRGVPDDAGRAAGRRARILLGHPPAGLPRAVAGSLVRDADHARAADGGRQRATRRVDCPASRSLPRPSDAILQPRRRQSVLSRGARARPWPSAAQSDERIPDTVQGVIMARLDRLPDAAKQLLQTASVLGREVPLRALARVWRAARSRRAARELCRQEFLYERPAATRPCLVFKHALTQDVAYDSLLSRRRLRASLSKPRGRSKSCTAIARRDHRDTRLSLCAHRSDRRIGDMADARGRAGGARLRQRRSDPAPRSGGAAAAAPARRTRSGSADAGRRAAPRAFAVFPRPVSRERRCAAAARGARGSTR